MMLIPLLSSGVSESEAIHVECQAGLLRGAIACCRCSGACERDGPMPTTHRLTSVVMLKHAATCGD
jgi:hypothetical protein